jgi:nitronate monooxygenase
MSNENSPQILNGGMGVAASNWHLARVVSKLGQGGIVSGTALNVLMARRLQDGDPGGYMQHALLNFPFPEISRRIVNKYYNPNGRRGKPYKLTPMPQMNNGREFNELCVAANFAEVFLAKEGHNGFVGINYLEKIQFPHLPSIYGAMLAGVDGFFIGAGVAKEVPNVLDALVNHSPSKYPLNVSGALPNETYSMTFNPEILLKEARNVPNVLSRPLFVPIVGLPVMAQYLIKSTGGKNSGRVNKLYVERVCSGGHNTPPRGQMKLNEKGEPIYGIDDEPKLEKLRDLGVPFWLAGGYGSPEGLAKAKKEGALGIAVGTAFALCTDSGLNPILRRALVQRALDGKADVKNDPFASPAGFPFRVAGLEGTLSEDGVFSSRKKICDLGFLRTSYRGTDGSVRYRCPAEPDSEFITKGGKEEDIFGRKCICNGLVASAGMPQISEDGTAEPEIFTLGADYPKVVQFCKDRNPDYTAERVINMILGKEK